MSRENGLARMRTVFILGCIVLVCIFYWDVVVLHRLSRSSRSSHSHNNRINAAAEGWSWECSATEDRAQVCRRVLSPTHPASSMCFDTCTMTCSPGSSIWPLPTGEVKVRNTSASFNAQKLKVDFTPVNSLELSMLLKKTTKLYQERISKMAKTSNTNSVSSSLSVMVEITKKSKDVRYKLNIDESYKVTVSQKGSTLKAVIKAATFLGAHHGLETLTQLIWWDASSQTLKVMNNAVITDVPIFTYRGLMLDTARNFIPTTSILRTLDAMSMNKLNVFHWHLTDSKSFPFDSVKYPRFAQTGPYSVKKTYSPADIDVVVEYAKARGVTVMVEIGAPAHNAQGWGWGEEDKGNLSLCLDSQPFQEFCAEPPCGQLNPVNNNSYSVLAGLLKEINTITKFNDVMHIGGEDVNLRCWESFGDVTDTDVYMNKGIVGVLEMFYKTLLKKLTEVKVTPRNIVVWSIDLLSGSDFWWQFKQISPIVQSKSPSTSGELETLVKQGLRVIVSSEDAWSLSEPRAWQQVYHHRPWSELRPSERRLVVGGEALAWTDALDQHSLDSALWPAVAAVAERLWFDPGTSASPRDRLATFVQRMLQEGIGSSPVGPKWCLQNPYQCT